MCVYFSNARIAYAEHEWKNQNKISWVYFVYGDVVDEWWRMCVCFWVSVAKEEGH